jgi:hypothetical protein
MRLSIVFPAYNEEANVGAAVEDALAYLGDRDGEGLKGRRSAPPPDRSVRPQAPRGAGVRSKMVG